MLSQSGIIFTFCLLSTIPSRGDSIVCDDTRECAFTTIECAEGEDCQVFCGESGCRASIIECPEGDYSCDVTCEGTNACNDFYLNCRDTDGSCLLTCDGKSACTQATVASDAQVTNVTCAGGVGSCEELILSCVKSDTCNLTCLGGANGCAAAQMLCPTQGSCSAKCLESAFDCEDGTDKCVSTCFNFEMDCTYTSTCALDCEYSAESGFPFACFSARQFFSPSTSVSCEGCDVDGDYFVSQLQGDDLSERSSNSDIESDFSKLDQFAESLNGLHWSWFSTDDPCSFFDVSGVSYYLSLWYGLECDYENGGVLEVRLPASGLNGSVDLTSLPDTLEVLNLRQNGITGEARIDALGDLMKELLLANNQFEGSVYFTSDGKYGNLQVLELQGNQLTGTVDLTYVPPLLTTCFLYNNQLSGDLDLTRLTDTLTTVSFASNSFTGAVNLSAISQASSLKNFDISDNKLTGTIDFQQFGNRVQVINLANNFLSGGDSSFSRLPNSLTELDISGNMFDADLSTVMTLVSGLTRVTTVYANDNKLTGTLPSLSTLPETLSELNIAGNLITSVSAWGDSSDRNNKSLTLLNVGDNPISGAVDVQSLPNSLLELHVYGTDLSWNLVDWRDLPSSLTILDASDCPNFVGTPDFDGIRQNLGQVNILNTGATSFVDFDGLPETTKLSMDESVICDQSFCNFDIDDIACTRSKSRTSSVCTGLSACEQTCDCRGCFEPTPAPTTAKPTMEPTPEPSDRPTVRDGAPTSQPVTPLPTVETFVTLSVAESDGTSDFIFSANNRFELVATLENYQGIYFDVANDDLFVWECMNCGNYKNLNDLETNDYASIVNAQTGQNGAVTSTLTLFPTTSSITHCAVAPLVEDNIFELGKVYTIRFTATAYSSVHGESYTSSYTETIRLDVNAPPQNVSCSAQPSDTGTCFETEFVFACNDEHVYDENGYGRNASLSYQWILYSYARDSFVFATDSSADSQYTTNEVGYGSQTYALIVYDAELMTTCVEVEVTTDYPDGSQVCVCEDCNSSTSLVATVNGVISGVGQDTDSSDDLVDATQTLAGTGANTLAEQMQILIGIAEIIIEGLSSSDAVDELLDLFYNTTVKYVQLGDQIGWNNSAVTTAQFSLLMDACATLQYWRSAEESVSTAVANGEKLEYCVEVATFFVLVHSDVDASVSYTDTTYNILDVLGTRSSQDNVQCGGSLVSIDIPAAYANNFDTNVIDCCVARWASNLFEKSLDGTGTFQTPYIMIDLESGLEFGAQGEGRRRMVALDEEDDITLDECDPILFSLSYNNATFFQSLEAWQDCHFPQCTFWDGTANEWSEEGCYVLETRNDSFVCACNHLTYFGGGWEIWCPKVKTDVDFAFVSPTMDNILAYPASGICVAVLVVLYALFVFTASRWDDKPLLAIAHSTIKNYAQKSKKKMLIGAEQDVLANDELGALSKVKKLFDMNIKSHHILVSIWFRKDHTNIGSQTRIALFFTLMLGLIASAACLFGEVNNGVGEISFAFWASFLICLIPLMLAATFSYITPEERYSEKRLAALRKIEQIAQNAQKNLSQHDKKLKNQDNPGAAVAAVAAGDELVQEDDKADIVQKDAEGGKGDDEDIYGKGDNLELEEDNGGRSVQANLVQHAIEAQETNTAEPGGETGENTDVTGAQEARLKDFKRLIEKKRLEAAQRQHRRAAESIKRYNAAQETRRDLLMKKYILSPKFRCGAWTIIILFNILAIMLIFVYGLRMDAYYDTFNAVESDSTCSDAVDVGVKTSLNYDTTEEHLGYFPESKIYSATADTEDKWSGLLTNTTRWVITSLVMICLSLFVYNPLFVCCLQCCKVMRFDANAVTEGYFYTSDELLWDPTADYSNIQNDAVPGKVAHLHDGAADDLAAGSSKAMTDDHAARVSALVEQHMKLMASGGYRKSGLLAAGGNYKGAVIKLPPKPKFGDVKTPGLEENDDIDEEEEEEDDDVGTVGTVGLTVSAGATQAQAPQSSKWGVVASVESVGSVESKGGKVQDVLEMADMTKDKHTNANKGEDDSLLDMLDDVLSDVPDDVPDVPDVPDDNPQLAMATSTSVDRLPNLPKESIGNENVDESEDSDKLEIDDDFFGETLNEKRDN